MARDALTKMAAALIAMQFFHWFSPSQAYFRDYVVSRFDVTDEQLENDVYAWNVAAQFVSGALLVLLYVLFGPTLPIMAANLSLVGSNALILWGSSLTALITSQVLWAVSFSVIFLVPACLYFTETRAVFQTASSFNSAAMLSASMLSGLIGFLITHYGWGFKFTFNLAFGSSVIGFFVHAIPAVLLQVENPRFDDSETRLLQNDDMSVQKKPLGQTLFQTLKVVGSNGNVKFWLISYSLLRGLHTCTIMLWSILAYKIAPSEKSQQYLGLVTFCSYGAATIAVCFLIVFQRFVFKYASHLTIAGYVTSGAALFLLVYSENLAAFGAMLSGYNLVSEAVLAITVTQLALSISEIRFNLDVSAAFVVSMGLRYTVSLAMQTLLQLVLFQQWGRLKNIFNLFLQVDEQFQAFGYCLCIIAVLLLFFHFLMTRSDFSERMSP